VRKPQNEATTRKPARTTGDASTCRATTCNNEGPGGVQRAAMVNQGGQAKRPLRRGTAGQGGPTCNVLGGEGRNRTVDLPISSDNLCSYRSMQLLVAAPCPQRARGGRWHPAVPHGHTSRLTGVTVPAHEPPREDSQADSAGSPVTRSQSSDEIRGHVRGPRPRRRPRIPAWELRGRGPPGSYAKHREGRTTILRAARIGIEVGGM
jgi:hypothetical protein